MAMQLSVWRLEQLCSCCSCCSAMQKSQCEAAWTSCCAIALLAARYSTSSRCHLCRQPPVRTAALGLVRACHCHDRLSLFTRQDGLPVLWKSRARLSARRPPCRGLCEPVTERDLSCISQRSVALQHCTSAAITCGASLGSRARAIRDIRSCVSGAVVRRLVDACGAWMSHADVVSEVLTCRALPSGAVAPQDFGRSPYVARFINPCRVFARC